MKKILCNRQKRLWASIIVCALMVMGSTKALAQVAYAKFDQATRTLTFLYDETRTTLNAQEGEYALNSDTDQPTWKGESKNVTTVVFDETFSKARPTSCYMWFKAFSNLQSIEGMSNLVTDDVTNMEDMFNGCSSLTSLDVSHLNTSKVTTMKDMFRSCEGLDALDVTKFNTSKVTDFSGMFQGCSGLTEIDVSNLNTKNATTLSHLFMNCEKMQKLDLGKFKVTNVIDMSYMFYGCTRLANLDIYGWDRDTPNLDNTAYMFYNCCSLESINATSLYTGYVTNMAYMFYGCSSLKNLNTEFVYGYHVKDFTGTFQGCSSLTYLDIDRLSPYDAISMRRMFAGCEKLQTLDLTSFASDTLTDISEMFSGATALQTIYVSEDFDVSHCIDNNDIFKGCTSLMGGVPFDSNKTGKDMACAGTGYFMSYYCIGESQYDFTGTSIPFGIGSLDLTGADGFWSHMPSYADFAYYKRPHDGNKYGTICLPFTIYQGDNYKLYRLGGIDYENLIIKLTPTNSLKPGEAGIYSVDDSTAQTIEFNTVYSEVATKDPSRHIEDVEFIDLGGLCGTYYSQEIGEGVLILKDDKMVFSKIDWGSGNITFPTLDPFTCVILIDLDKDDDLRDRLTFDEEFTFEIDNFTHIDNIEEGNNTTAIPTAIYNTSGRKFQQLQRGLNIVKYSDGTIRKVMVK